MLRKKFYTLCELELDVLIKKNKIIYIYIISYKNKLYALLFIWQRDEIYYVEIHIFFLINVKYLTLQTILFTHFEIIKSRKIFVLDCKSTNIRWRNFARRENFSINSLE